MLKNFLLWPIQGGTIENDEKSFVRSVMKFFLQRLSARWFATTTPTHTPLITIEARETRRKRRLLSVILLIALSGVSFTLVMDILTRTEPSQQIQNLVGMSFISLSFWINRRGHLKLA